jgi:hypothetical protein
MTRRISTGLVRTLGRCSLPAFLMGLAAVALIAFPAWAASRVVEVRVGKHPTFTRVVFELDHSAGYRLERGAGDRSLIVTLDAAAESRSVRTRSRAIPKLTMESASGGAIARIELAKPATRVQEMILGNPPRIVIDVMRESVAPVARKRATPPPPRRVSTRKTTVTAKPTVTEKPIVTEKPPAVEKPIVAVEPTPIEKPTPTVAIEPTPVTPPKQVVPDKPTVAEKPTVADEPTVAEKPTVADEPIAVEEPTSPEPVDLVAQLPLEPETPEEPAAGQEPGADVEPLVAPRSAAIEEPAPRAAAIEPARTPVAPAPSQVGSLLRNPRVIGGIAAAGLLLIVGVALLRRRSSKAEDVSGEVDALEQAVAGLGRVPAGGFSMEDESPEPAGLGDDGDDSDLFGSEPQGGIGESASAGATVTSIFEEGASVAATSKGDAKMSQKLSDLPADRAGAAPSSPAAVSGDIARVLEEMQSRMAQLEAKLDEANDAREKLERQVAAQSEELRVQRAAIARTQRALRSMTRSGEDKATEPALRDDTQAKTRVNL